MIKLGLKLFLLLTITLIFTACMPKQDGKYHSKYSYHPYNDMTMKKATPKVTSMKMAKVIKTSVRKEHYEFKAKGQNPFQTVELYPSNVPAKRRY